VKKEFGDGHYKEGMFLNNLGLAQAMLNLYTDSYRELKKSLNILITCLGPDHIEVADCYSNLGDVCMKLHVESIDNEGKIDEAKKYYTSASKIVVDSLGPEHSKSMQLASLIFVCENYSLLAM